MAYPSVISTLSTPQATDRLNSPSHSTLHQNENTGITETQTFVGTLSSAVGTLVYDIRSTTSNGGGHVQTANKGGTGQTSFNKGDLLIGQSSSVLTRLAVGSDGLGLLADSTAATGVRWGLSNSKFAGTGVDGALSVTSGTTTISLGGLQTVIKNYTSISITGGTLAFSNPHANGTVLILKSQGDVTITSGATRAIDGRSMGAAGGAGGTSVSPGGTNGNAANGIIFVNASNGVGGGLSGAGAGGVQYTNTAFYFTSSNYLYNKTLYLTCGSGGGGGGGNSGGTNPCNGGAGAAGGLGLLIQSGGALNFTGTIDCSGGTGTAGSDGAGTTRPGAGGGGGSAGMVAVLYNSLTANSGTITTIGGTGGGSGTYASGNTGTPGGGGGGGVLAGAGGNGGTSGNSGLSGAGAGAGGGGSGSIANSGGTGGVSASGVVALNTEFA